ncbi:MAG: 6-pyruvoyl trahydropterin synthase family protein [Pseudonocardiaceae bacterium]
MAKTEGPVMFRIGKNFTFESAHRITGLPDGHKCARPHGHSYTVTVMLERQELIEPGFVTDFGELAPFKRYIDACLDHRDLNEVLDIAPTSELLARHLAEWFVEHLQPQLPGRLYAVRVSETATSWAEYEVPAR